jgi:hypothetical protein
LSLTDSSPAPAAAGEPPAIDERAVRRAVWQGEVVALAEEGDRVQLCLLGADLSEHGMRVEPHPLLTVGDRLRLALYDPKSAEPLIVEAWVARDDGARGCGLAFERIGSANRARLRSLVATAPPISSLGRGAKRAEGVVVGEIVKIAKRRA